jgi:hypothetical protein
MATMSVLRPELQPIGTQSVGKLLWVWDNVGRICDYEGTEEYSVRTR